MLQVNILNNASIKKNYKSELQTNIIQDLGNLPQNKLSQVMTYSISLLEECDYYLGLLIPCLSTYQHSWCLGNSIMYSLSALYTIYDLEHMLNNPMRNKKPSCHIFFGESVSQLAALCTTIRCNNIVINNQNISNFIKTNIIRIFNNQNLEEQVLNSQIQQVTQIQDHDINGIKELIHKDFIEKKGNLVTIALQIVLVLEQEELEEDILNQLSNCIYTLIQNPKKSETPETPEIIRKITLLCYGTCFENKIAGYLRIFN